MNKTFTKEQLTSWIAGLQEAAKNDEQFLVDWFKRTKESIIIENLLEVAYTKVEPPSTKSDSVHFIIAFLKSHYRSIKNWPNSKDHQQNESWRKVEPRFPLLFVVNHNELSLKNESFFSILIENKYLMGFKRERYRFSCCINISIRVDN